MKSKRKKIIVLIVLVMGFVFLPNIKLDFKVEQTTFNNLKSSQSDSGIEIDALMTYNTTYSGNWTWAVSQPWCYIDNGVYIIENMTIDATSSPIDSGILIKNSNDDSFIVRNCTITNVAGPADPRAGGIKLVNCSRGILRNNTCSDSGDRGSGILVYDYSHNITIEDNFINSHPYHGISLSSSNLIEAEVTYNITIKNNIVHGSGWYGIYLRFSDNVTIRDNNADDNNMRGIYLVEGCDDNKIINNNVSDNGVGFTQELGIYLDGCDNNTIIGNNASGNGDGILLKSSHNNAIQGNIANDNGGKGIYIYIDCDNNSISGNIVNNNSIHGIYFDSNCDFNNITENTVNDNTGHGIYLNNCKFNNITDNAINDNADVGIHLYFNSNDNDIKNNTINRNDLGIGIYWSDNNNISGNTLIDNSFCIYENEESAGNIIEYNDCSPPTVQEPIFIDGADIGVGAHNWTWAEKQSWCSGSGTWNDPYIIENLKISGFGAGTGYGIEILNSNVSFIIQDCLIYNTETGIYLENVNNSRLINNNCSNLEYGIFLNTCDNNTLSGNTVNGNDYEGIYLDTCNNNTLSGNTANDNQYGISLNYCDYHNVTGNTANDNGDSGIYLDSANNNTISGNTANDNDIAGIFLYDSDYNNITGNTASGNIYNGIFLDDENDNNIIAGNIFNNNGYGIEIHYSDFNSIIGNTANDNSYYGIKIEVSNNNTISGNNANNNTVYGIYIHEQSNNNTFSENILYNNTIGVYIDNSDNNLIYKNLFLENGKHAEDGGTDNKWNSTSIGNYWDNWTSPDVNPNDGIVDLPYSISGLAGSKDYLPIAEDGAPSITINSPTSSDVFAVTAPSFDVTITDIYLDERWYTIDGGINNYTFIENGIINQTAWAAKTEGDVTITFYASDIFSNIGKIEVTVAKDTTNPIIIIHSPTDGEEFGTQAPLFNITVTDDHLDSIWYSFDGGVTTFAITDNTVFNQTAWTALAEGDVTITFYANDTLGHEASEAVTVEKIISAGGVDPIIIVVIVVVSIAGGVAVAAVIFIYLKKRASPK